MRDRALRPEPVKRLAPGRGRWSGARHERGSEAGLGVLECPVTARAPGPGLYAPSLRGTGALPDERACIAAVPGRGEERGEPGRGAVASDASDAGELRPGGASSIDGQIQRASGAQMGSSSAYAQLALMAPIGGHLGVRFVIDGATTFYRFTGDPFLVPGGGIPWD